MPKHTSSIAALYRKFRVKTSAAEAETEGETDKCNVQASSVSSAGRAATARAKLEIIHAQTKIQMLMDILAEEKDKANAARVRAVEEYDNMIGGMEVLVAESLTHGEAFAEALGKEIEKAKAARAGVAEDHDGMIKRMEALIVGMDVSVDELEAAFESLKNSR